MTFGNDDFNNDGGNERGIHIPLRKQEATLPIVSVLAMYVSKDNHEYNYEGWEIMIISVPWARVNSKSGFKSPNRVSSFIPVISSILMSNGCDQISVNGCIKMAIMSRNTKQFVSNLSELGYFHVNICLLSFIYIRIYLCLH